MQTQNSIQQASCNYRAAKMDLQREKTILPECDPRIFLQLMNDEDVLVLAKAQRM